MSACLTCSFSENPHGPFLCYRSTQVTVRVTSGQHAVAAGLTSALTESLYASMLHYTSMLQESLLDDKGMPWIFNTRPLLTDCFTQTAFTSSVFFDEYMPAAVFSHRQDYDTPEVVLSA